MRPQKLSFLERVFIHLGAYSLILFLMLLFIWTGPLTLAWLLAIPSLLDQMATETLSRKKRKWDAKYAEGVN